MHKITITSIAALTVLFGASFAASASDDGRYEGEYRLSNTSESPEYCRDDDKDCGYRNRRDRNHESREYRSGDNDDGYRHRDGRRQHDKD